MFKIVKTFPELLSNNKNGQITHWRLHVAKDGDLAYVITYLWKLDESKKQEYVKPVQGKNKGRANETTPLEQAFKEAEASYVYKRKLGFYEEGKAPVEGLPRPMLAKSYWKNQGKVVYPCIVQPKVNGIRAPYTGEVFYSRELNVFKGVSEVLNFDTMGHIIDGELKLPDTNFLQETVEAMRGSPKDLHYYVYDIVDPTGKLPFKERLKILSEIVKKNTNTPWLHLVPSRYAYNEEGIRKLHDLFVTASVHASLGREGAIIRNIDSPYLMRYRSNDLLKFKDAIEREYKILDVYPAKVEGTVVFNVKLDGDKAFEVTPEGSVDKRKKYLKDRDKLIGEKLTVRHEKDYTKAGYPKNAVGVAIRNYE